MAQVTNEGNHLPPPSVSVVKIILLFFPRLGRLSFLKVSFVYGETKALFQRPLFPSLDHVSPPIHDDGRVGGCGGPLALVPRRGQLGGARFGAEDPAAKSDDAAALAVVVVVGPNGPFGVRRRRRRRLLLRSASIGQAHQGAAVQTSSRVAEKEAAESVEAA